MPYANIETKRQKERERYWKKRDFMRAQQREYQSSLTNEQRAIKNARARNSYRRNKGSGKKATYSKAWMEKKLEEDPTYQSRISAKYRETSPVYPAKAAGHAATRRSAKLKRTPPWADINAINFFYECRPEGCHVDHVIPLVGKNVSGFHVAENLQWLPAHKNLVKSNNF